MKPIRLLLVDDEELVLNAIRRCIEKADMGFVVDTALNGRSALDKARVFKPQVVISDIEMPQLDGLSFLQELKTINDTSQIYVLSGYQNFNYAKKAIDIGVKKYIIKPLEEEQLLALLKEARTVLEQQNSMSQRQKHSNKLAQKSLLRELLLISESDLPDDIRKLAPSLIPNNIFMLATLQLSGRGNNEISNSAALAVSNFHVYLEEIVAAALDAYNMEGVLTPRRKNEYILLIHQLENQDTATALRLLETILKNIEKALGLSVTAKTSLPKQGDLRELSSAFNQCVSALKIIYKNGRCKILSYAQGSGRTASLEKEQEFSQCLENQTFSSIGEIVTQLYDALASENLVFADAVEITERLLAALMTKRLIYQHNEKQIQPSLGLCDTLYALRETVLAQAKPLCNYDCTTMTRTENLIFEARKFMKQHLGEVSLNMVSEAVGVTPIYLSTVFRNSTGTKFIDYVTQMKIDAAKEMLADRSIKIHQISARLGYLDSKHFSRIFKRNVGITPNEYRMAQGASHQITGGI